VGLQKAVAAGDQARAEKLNAKLAEFVDWIEKFPTPMGIKRAVELRGQKSGTLGVPLAPETSSEMEAFLLWFKEWHQHII
jgi:dihydrodipicolinate synthase/N-acetylneuraminate lyase